MLYSMFRQPVRMWRNWYTRTLEVRVALPCEFESRHPHVLFISQGSIVKGQKTLDC